MIQIAEAPVELQQIESGYAQNSMEQALLREMTASRNDFTYDSEEELKFELALRTATVDAAKALDHSGMAFAVFRKSRCNADYWDRTDDGGFVLKSDASPSDGIRDIFQNGSKYATECATAILIVFYKAMLAVFSDTLFNKTFHEIELMNWHHVDPLFRSVAIMTHTGNFLPGDRRYFMNPDVNPIEPEWQGENVIMLDTDSYYGHGIGIQNEAAMIEELNRNRVKDAEESAYLMKRAGRPNYRKLLNIKNDYHS